MLYVISEAKKSDENKLIHRFANWQLWPLAVTVLRTGLIFTRGHPWQGPVQGLGISLTFSQSAGASALRLPRQKGARNA